MHLKAPAAERGGRRAGPYRAALGRALWPGHLQGGQLQVLHQVGRRHGFPSPLRSRRPRPAPPSPRALGPLTLGNARGSSCRKIKFLSGAPRGASARETNFSARGSSAVRACQPPGRPPGAPRARPRVFLSRLSLARWRLWLSGTPQPAAPGGGSANSQRFACGRPRWRAGSVLQGGREQEEEAGVGGKGKRQRGEGKRWIKTNKMSGGRGYRVRGGHICPERAGTGSDS